MTREGTKSWRKVTAFIFCMLCLAGLAGPSCADTIFLKNGNRIHGRILREDSTTVYYEIDGNQIAIPRNLVAGIKVSANDEPEQVPAQDQPSANGRAVPLPRPVARTIPSDSDVLQDGAINNRYLSHLDDLARENPSQENLHRLSHAYQQAGIFLTQSGRPEEAIEEYRHALSLDPDDLTLTLALGYSLIKQEHYWRAINTLSPAQDQHPDLPDLSLLLGSAYYGLEDLDNAIAEWKRTLQIHNDPEVRRALQRAERERALSGNFQALRSEHFILRYGDGVPRNFVNEVITSLENSYLAIANDLNDFPQEPIVVLLYSNQTFRDITRTPGWVGAINDGKIRIPVSGLSTVTPDLARVLRHELTHSFVYQITMGRCPVWFNEGLAQLEEGANTASLGSRLTRAFATLPPYSALEGSFMNLPPSEVMMVYGKCLAALEYLRDTYGMSEIRLLLKRMAAHPDFESQLQDELHVNYAQFEQDVASYVSQKYGE